MTEYQDKHGKIVLAKKTIHSVYLKAKGWVLPYTPSLNFPGYIVQLLGTKPNNKVYPNAIEWVDENEFHEQYTKVGIGVAHNLRKEGWEL